MSNLNPEKKQPLSLAQIQDRLFQLRTELVTDLHYGLPCYEDGTLSPRRILQRLLSELTELEESAFRLVTQGQSRLLPVPEDFVSSLDLGSIQPPATPESLSTHSWYSPDDMELTQGSDWDLEVGLDQPPL